jgi:hypothetical protein
MSIDKINPFAIPYKAKNEIVPKIYKNFLTDEDVKEIIGEDGTIISVYKKDGTKKDNITIELEVREAKKRAKKAIGTEPTLSIEEKLKAQKKALPDELQQGIFMGKANLKKMKVPEFIPERPKPKQKTDEDYKN